MRWTDPFAVFRILDSPEKSLYRELRREPRRECLSTIETIAESLTALGEKKEVAAQLKKVFASLLDRKRELTQKKREARKTSTRSIESEKNPSNPDHSEEPTEDSEG